MKKEIKAHAVILFFSLLATALVMWPQIMYVYAQVTTTRVYRLPVISWVAPTTNADASPLEDLAGFELLVTVEGDDPAAAGTVPLGRVQIDDPLATEYRGTTLWTTVPLERVSVWLAALDTTGNLSVYTGPVLVDRRELPPSAPTGVTVKVIVVTEVE